mgnify:CR=1 FL=1
MPLDALSLEKEWKYKMRRENHWQPPLEPILLNLYDHIRYYFKACVNRIWATIRNFEFSFLSAEKSIFVI